MTNVYDRERALFEEIAPSVERDLPGVEVLALELSGPESFCIYVDHPGGVDLALCERVTNVLRPYLDRFSVDVSSPGSERPVRTPAHFRRAVGREVRLRTAERRRIRGEVLAAGDRAVTVASGGDRLDVPYEAIVRGNLIDREVRR
jgi:ribosome maturation factor RimP